jgi:two-component system, chemotaxis family, sensor kinase CheA
MASQDFLQDYADEVREHLQELESSLLILEREGTNKEEINQIFRAAHSIKGASAYMGFEKLAGLTHELESLMSEIQAQSRPVPPRGITLLLECVDYISGAVKRILEGGEELTVPERLLVDLRAVLREEPAAESGVGSVRGEAVAGLQIPEDEALTQELDELVIGPQDASISELGVSELVEDSVPSASESKGPAVEPEEIKPEEGLSEEPESIHEDDKELYNIFLASFDEQFLELMKVFSTTGSNLMPDEGFERAFAAIKRLESSSQYMDYGRVVDVLATAATLLAESQLGGATGDQCLAHFVKIGSDLQAILPGFRAPGLEPASEALGEPAETVEEEDEELYAIFLDSCQQHFAELAKLTHDPLDALMSNEMYLAAREWLQRIVSSSKYMDYDDVAEFVERGEQNLSDAHSAGGLTGHLFSELLSSWRQGLETMLPRLQLGVETPVTQAAVGTGAQEEDEELFSIFLDNCRQHFTALVRMTPSPLDRMLADEDYELALGLIERLGASSRYMDYERLVSSLKEWEEALLEARQKGELDGHCYSRLLNQYGAHLQELMSTVLGPAVQVAEEEEPVFAEVEQEFDVFETITDEQASVAPDEGIGDRELPVSSAPEKAVQKGRAVSPAEEAVTAVTLRVDAQKVDQLLNQVGELVVTRSEFIQTASLFRDLLGELASHGKLSKQEVRRLRALSFRMNESTQSLGRVANDLQGSVMRIRMLPIAQLFQRFPRVIRDQAFSLGKKVELAVEGGDTEIDKRVLEQMYDPIVQFLRNAIVHGIEAPRERKLAGKPETGTIRLAAYHEGDYVILEIEDDGRGIDTKKLRKILESRREMGVQELERLTEEEVLYAIFLPGISTHGRVDGTAGRGVGLDVVKENVERMNGTIEVASYPGVGTRFTIRIPLTVAIIRALLVKGAGQIFTLPLASVSEIVRYRYRETHTIEGFQVITLRGDTIPLVHLTQLTRLPVNRSDDEHKFIVVVATSFREVGLVVDGLVGEREVVIKSIEQDFHSFDGFSGATILGDGTVSLIIDVSALLRSLKDTLQERPRMLERSLH